ncbi:hypothetical protein QAD02_014960 [Eretmocerus hayati]|uniref:Uncharacterized protein n=1 Tax=Eretmocerus hayati TaxID=131215 RepID=A0ACC2P7U3_9HYME|nr:hypothetical protein QAD02_014960 [Eretmocerus hayati]
MTANVVRQIFLLIILNIFSGSVTSTFNQFHPNIHLTNNPNHYIVSIQYYNFHICGGSMIRRNVVLTAGHCIYNYPIDTMTVRAGSVRFDSGGTVANVVNFVRHQNFHKDSFNRSVHDIALLKLGKSIMRGVTIIGLFMQNEIVVPGSVGTVAGWGIMDEYNRVPNMELRVIHPYVIDKRDCSREYWLWNGVSDVTICTFLPNQSTCKGDSGGPLVVDGRQAGIISWCRGCARSGFPVAYTEVSSYRNWIEQNIMQLMLAPHVVTYLNPWYTGDWQLPPAYYKAIAKKRSLDKQLQEQKDHKKTRRDAT